MFLFVGTYTAGPPRAAGKAEGISTMRWDAATGALSPVALASGIANPSFLALHPSGRWLYAPCEAEVGMLVAFAIQTDGSLARLNDAPSGGPSASHLSVDRGGKFLLAVNYRSGTVSVTALAADGRLGAMTDFVQHRGARVNAARQQSAHAHSVQLSGDNRHAIVADLGMDRLMVYRFDGEQGRLSPGDPAEVALAPGAGPRHFAFDPARRFAYVINELDSTVSVFAYDDARASFDPVQTVSTLPAGFDGDNACADIHVHPSGRWLYGSNRGHDSIAIFARDEATGRLAPLGHEPTLGRTPRNFALSPGGDYLLAANQESDTIVTFRIDRATGRLFPAGQVCRTPTPVCLLFAP